MDINQNKQKIDASGEKVATLGNDYIRAKDEGVGLRQVQFVAPKPISKIEEKKSDKDELKRLFSEHEINYFGWTVQNVQQSA